MSFQENRQEETQIYFTLSELLSSNKSKFQRSEVFQLENTYFSRPERQSDSSKSSMHHQHHHSHHFPHRQHPSTIYQQQHVRQASQATTAPSIDDQTEQKDWLHGVHV